MMRRQQRKCSLPIASNLRVRRVEMGGIAPAASQTASALDSMSPHAADDHICSPAEASASQTTRLSLVNQAVCES